ncbi:uncharacterized protein LOC143293853 [Babylonia areolata]|uniref:uncharacterized protein LOC143293853 n=1 Tax=Babylonia areolata TaxID=304850 RepID=UPI003FD6A51C
MTGDKMKSDCTMDSRYRSEGRPSLPRRRVATKTSHENGDFEMELSLAIKESLKYAKEKEGQLKGVDKTSPLLNGVKSDESFSRMAGKVLTFATSSDQGQGSEVQQLKDLLLIHIELIQHQQEQLANKDKEIRILRNEKDTLQCRLQKVEKRFVQLKQKEDLLEAQIANAKSSAAAAQEASPVPEQRERNKLVAKVEHPPGRKRRQQYQKGQPKRQRKAQKLAAGVDKASGSVTSEEEDAEESDSGDEEEGDDEDRDEDEASDVEGEDERDGEETEDSMARYHKKKKKVKEEVDENKDPHPEPVLRTDCLYHVSCCVELPPDDVMEVNDEKEVVTGDEVETPGWRINVLTNRYQLEGTENITDEAYQKRHQKHEVEEKRRKRWDIQRMREQKVFEKLRGKEEPSSSPAQMEQSLKTFLPCIEDVTHLEISEHVPIMAFGEAVPHVEPSEFELPWDTGPASSYTRKSHGGRGRQK